MAFVDEVRISVQSGAGGNGCVSFRREKYVPKGGPDGGHGGRGGNVIFRATHNKSSLLDFKYEPKYEADRGEHGRGKDQEGRSGSDLTLQVPVGTLVYDEDSGDLLYDLSVPEQQITIAQGGRGGKGNRAFTSSTNRAPRYATPGKPGQKKQLRLELRLLADFGLIGLPNAGKSSLLQAISRARPTVANYAFTTLNPHLGVVAHKAVQFTVADLPGLIEGASQGHGLGHQFLRHISRTHTLLHVIDIFHSVEEIERNIEIIRKELREFNSKLANQTELLIFSKCDLLSPEELTEKLAKLESLGFKGTAISSQTKFGIDLFLDELSSLQSAGSAQSMEQAQ